MTPAEREALRAELRRWPAIWRPNLFDMDGDPVDAESGDAFTWSGSWTVDSDGGEDLEMGPDDDCGPQLAKFIAELVMAAPRLLDELDELELKAIQARRRISEAESDVVDLVKTAVAGQCGCMFAPCVHDEVRAAIAGKHETQASIARWASDTFGEPTNNLSIAKRALTELLELVECLEANDCDPSCVVEAADVEIVLARLYERFGAKRQDEIDKKMAINRARRWTRGGDGHGKHIKEGA